MTDREQLMALVFSFLTLAAVVASIQTTDALARQRYAPMACEGSAGPVVHPTAWPKRGDPVRPGALPAAVDAPIPDSVRVGR